MEEAALFTVVRQIVIATALSYVVIIGLSKCAVIRILPPILR